MQNLSTLKTSVIICSIFLNLIGVKTMATTTEGKKITNSKTNKNVGSETLTSKIPSLNEKGTNNMDALFSINLLTANNKNIKLKDFAKSKVFLFVNTASNCGYTKQYEGLEKLFKKFQNKGLAIIGFPSNDFGGQEPGTNSEIQEFCKLNYGITFPIMAKNSVVGDKIQPIYQELLKLSSDKSDVSWNFEKFLVAKESGVITRYKSNYKPEDLEPIIAKLLE